MYTLISFQISRVDDRASEDPMLVKGLQKRTQSKRRPEKSGQTPSDGKVSFT